jgi:hypothetical protein
LDPPTDINYYLIRIKKDPISKTEEEKFLEKKEEKFVLDSLNIVGSRMKDYDPLYDNNLSSFFSSKIIRSHLENKGFIDKEGIIVKDPEKRKIAKIETKNILKIYENEKNHLQKIKNQKEKIRLQIRNLLNTNMKTLKSGNLKDLNKLSKIYTYSPIGKNRIQLMDLKTTSMKSTKFKNSVYLKQISKGKKPKSLFDMNININSNDYKTRNSNTQSPLKIDNNNKTNTNIDTITSNRYMTMENVRVSSIEKTEKAISRENSRKKERIRSKSILSPIRIKSGIGLHTKSRAESRYTSDRMKSISITENNINKDLNNILNNYDNYETYNNNFNKNDNENNNNINNINDPIMIDDNVVIAMKENDNDNEKNRSGIFREEKKEIYKSEKSSSINKSINKSLNKSIIKSVDKSINKSKSIVKSRLSSNSNIISGNGKKDNKDKKDKKDKKDNKDKKIEEKEIKNNENLLGEKDKAKDIDKDKDNDKDNEFDIKNIKNNMENIYKEKDEKIVKIETNENENKNKIEETIKVNNIINEEEIKLNNKPLEIINENKENFIDKANANANAKDNYNDDSNNNNNENLQESKNNKY